MIRKSGKPFLATLPPEIHGALRVDAQMTKAKVGGHLSINRAMVNCLFSALRHRLTAEQREAVEIFLRKH